VSSINSVFWAVVDFLQAYNGAVTAIATVFIGIFTLVLARVTGHQARLTRDSIALSRQDFVATHRPRVIVRFVGAIDYDDQPREFVPLHVVNIGINDAIILEFGGDLARRDEDGTWLTPGADGAPTKIIPIKLTSGQRHVFQVLSRDSFGDAQIADDAIGRTQICVFGAFRYSDENNIVRETGFFRVWSNESRHFVPSTDPGEEYQD
jgi:hypothetical protein